MKITRRGTSSDHGPSDIELGDVAVKWQSSPAFVHLRATGVRDFNREAHHDYDIRMSVEELRALLGALGRAALEVPEELHAVLEPSVVDLTRLVAVGAGLARKK